MKTIISTLVMLLILVNTAFSQCNPQLTASVNGNNVTFTNSSTPNFIVGAQISYTLDFGDGSAINYNSWPGNGVFHQYLNGGNYIATLQQTILDSINSSTICIANDTVQLMIINSISCTITPTISNTLSTSTSNQVDFAILPNVVMNPSNASYGIQINYDYGDGTTGTSSSHSYSASGNYTVIANVSTTDPNNSSVVYCSAIASTVVNFTYINPCNSVPTFNLGLANANTATISGINQASYVTGNVYNYVIDYGDGSNYSTQYLSNSYTHFYPTAGTYTVCITETIMDSLNNIILCTNNFCNTITITNSVPMYSGCDANYYVYSDSINNTLEYTFYGSASTTSSGTITSYSWDFGDGSTGSGLIQSHLYATAGIYNVCLTITTSNNCTDVTCFNVDAHAINVSTMSTISGAVFDNNSVSVPNTIVYLIKMDPVTQSLNLVQSKTTIWNGNMYWFHVNPGSYLVKAAVLPTNNSPISNLVPTYSLSAALWNNATTTTLTPGVASYVNNVNIIMQTGTNTNGPGFISGSIITGANKTTAVGDPKEGLTVLLINTSTNSVAAYTTTDENGDYEFNSVAIGNYNVYVEEFGKTMTPKSLSISNTNASYTGIDFESNSKENHPLAPASNSDVKALSDFVSIYPNPVTENLYIRFANETTEKTEISIMSIDGRIIQSVSEKNLQVTQIDTKALQSGVYFIKIKQGNQVITKQFSKF